MIFSIFMTILMAVWLFTGLYAAFMTIRDDIRSEKERKQKMVTTNDNN